MESEMESIPVLSREQQRQFLQGLLVAALETLNDSDMHPGQIKEEELLALTYEFVAITESVAKRLGIKFGYFLLLQGLILMGVGGANAGAGVAEEETNAES